MHGAGAFQFFPDTCEDKHLVSKWYLSSTVQLMRNAGAFQFFPDT